MQPAFTVIMATWNRGRHILPSVRAILAQSCRDFELLVIGDSVTDDTAVHLAALQDPRLRWISNTPRWGTQSGPNNRGIAEARAPWVAYCGHDDIWAPDHLEALQEAIGRYPGADAVVSGLLVHRMHAARPFAVYGLLEDFAADAARCFVQPSATAHRTSVIRNHLWPRPEDVEVPVDLHVQQQLIKAGAAFAATSRITVHKFTAAGRYLSYFDVSSVEQETMLERMKAPDYETWLAAAARQARDSGDYMAAEQRPAGKAANTERVARIARARGVEGLPENMRVRRGICLLQSGEPRAQDWHGFPEGESYRAAGPNPRPKMLLPLLSGSWVELRLQVRAPRLPLIRALRLWLNGSRVKHTVERLEKRDGQHWAQIVLRGRLYPDKASVLTIEHLDEKFASGEIRRGIAVGAVQAVPLEVLKAGG